MNPTNCFLTAFKIYQELQVHQHVTSLDYLIHEFGHGFPLISFDFLIYIYYRKIHCLTSEFHVKFHAKNRYRTHRFAIRAISVFQVKFNVEFTSQAVNFS